MDGAHVNQQGLVAVTPWWTRALGLVMTRPGEVPAGTDFQYLTGDAHWILLPTPSSVMEYPAVRTVSITKRVLYWQQSTVFAYLDETHCEII